MHQFACGQYDGMFNAVGGMIDDFAEDALVFFRSKQSPKSGAFNLLRSALFKCVAILADTTTVKQQFHSNKRSFLRQSKFEEKGRERERKQQRKIQFDSNLNWYSFHFGRNFKLIF